MAAYQCDSHLCDVLPAKGNGDILPQNDGPENSAGEVDYLQFALPCKGREIIVSSMADASIDGVLDIHIHHARDIHNICIYGNQDVYAKFSITHSQDTVYSTQPVRGGGKNPIFNQSLQILVSRLDAVLKCEIWMMSSMRSCLEDQMLGFVLVPLVDMLGREKHTQDYTLSSTDLFHMPAGTVCLSLEFYARGMDHRVEHTPEVIDVDNRHMSIPSPDLRSIEFPDLRIMSENQELVSLYLDMAAPDLKQNLGEHSDASRTKEEHPLNFSFLHLGSSSINTQMFEMQAREERLKGVTLHSDDNNVWSTNVAVDEIVNDNADDVVNVSPEVLEATSSVSTMSTEQELNEAHPSAAHYHPKSSQDTCSPGTATSGCGLLSVDNNNGLESRGSLGSLPVVNITLEPTEPAVHQQQIVDIYMKNIQQFSESLAKMKLPLDLDGAQSHMEVTKTDHTANEGVGNSQKDSHRVFYGSRAFF